MMSRSSSKILCVCIVQLTGAVCVLFGGDWVVSRLGDLVFGLRLFVQDLQAYPSRKP